MLLSLALTFVLAATPLTEADRAALAEVTDDSPRLQQSGFFRLLENALSATPGDERGAVIRSMPDLLGDPAAHRGELVLLEGVFAGRSQQVELVRPGPWGEAVTEWVLVVDAGVEGTYEDDEVAVVYLVTPAGVSPPATPRKGQPIRLAARFYKVLRAPDLQGQPTRFPTFVAPSPPAGATAAAFRPAGRSLDGPMIALLLGLVVGMVGLLFWLRRRVREVRDTPPVRRRPASEPAVASSEEDDPDEPAPPLPDDPSEALERLRADHDDAPRGA